jgi:hypothetical protein
MLKVALNTINQIKSHAWDIFFYRYTMYTDQSFTLIKSLRETEKKDITQNYTEV